MRENKMDKAKRLVKENKIEKVTAWTVVGDNDTYVVAWNGAELECSCPTQDVECSHMIAVALQNVPE